MTKDGKKEWLFQERHVAAEINGMLLMRLTVAKVADRHELVHILRQVPVKQGDSEWNCVYWVKEALEKLAAHGKVLGTNRVIWEDITDTALWYVDKKTKEHRFDGHGDFDMTKVATYDIMECKETVP
jgi:hypothetical protein